MMRVDLGWVAFGISFWFGSEKWIRFGRGAAMHVVLEKLLGFNLMFAPLSHSPFD